LPENTRLREGDVLDIDIEDAILRIWEFRGDNVERSTLNVQLDPGRILFEDSDLLIYDKPS
jgi:23S rRNA-/tRNA-specific pseudouridylate synthase